MTTNVDLSLSIQNDLVEEFYNNIKDAGFTIMEACDDYNILSNYTDFLESIEVLQAPFEQDEMIEDVMGWTPTLRSHPLPSAEDGLFEYAVEALREDLVFTFNYIVGMRGFISEVMYYQDVDHCNTIIFVKF